MKSGIVFVVLLTVAGLFAVAQTPVKTGAEASRAGLVPASDKKTIAHRFLALELEGASVPAFEYKLEAIIERAVRKFGVPKPTEGASATAQRFFRAVDSALTEEDVVFPPGSQVDLLSKALNPQVLSPEEYNKALNVLPNLRRRSAMEANHRVEGAFYFFDCDVAGLIYLGAAERLGLPVYMVEVPGHNFVRWSSRDLRLNWDTNDGVLTPDAFYFKATADNETERRLLGYLENRTEARLTSYWLVRCAQADMLQRDYVGALKKLRAAVAADSNDLVARGELAWALATMPDEHLRNGREAREIAEKLVALLRSRSWLETLAAACAETGDFTTAVRLQKEAQQWVLTQYVTVPAETKDYHQTLIAAYEKKSTYAVAIQKGFIKPADNVGRIGR